SEPVLARTTVASPMPSAGLPSSLMIVPVPVARPSVYPFDGFDRVTLNVSLGSSAVSPYTCTVNVFDTVPFLNDTLPLASLKSTPSCLPLPPVAVTPVTVYCALTVFVAGFDNVAVNVILRVPLLPSSIEASPTDTVEGTPGTNFEIVP